MNWTVLILFVVFYCIPMLYIAYRWQRNNEEADRKYEQRRKEIEQHYGVKL
jgi:beta-lactamase regulating signal transducer with metallopeptidase domain